MPRYLYDDEDNAAMCPELFDNPLDINGHNPTVYLSTAEMKYFESLPFDGEPEEPTADILEDEQNDHA